MEVSFALHRENDRVAALQQYGIDNSTQGYFGEIVAELAAEFQTSIAGVTFVEAERQWSKAIIGLPRRSIPRADGFCTRTILSDSPLLVEDATADIRFAHLPLVTRQPAIRFYAGAPLIDRRGFRLGAVCIADYRPQTLAAGRLATLERFAVRTMSHIELHRLRLIYPRDLADFLLEQANEAQVTRNQAAAEHYVNLIFALCDEQSHATAIRLNVGRPLAATH